MDLPALFFFKDTATTEIYTLSLHDALPIWSARTAASTCSSSSTGPWVRSASNRTSTIGAVSDAGASATFRVLVYSDDAADRKSTRLNSSHANISYAVFCLQKKIYRLKLKQV